MDEATPLLTTTRRRTPATALLAVAGLLAVTGTACRAAAPQSRARPAARAAATAARSSAAPDYIWWEAETPRATNFPPAAQNPFAPASQQERDVLSGGAWIGTESDRTQPLFLEYDVSVPTQGTYQFYVRKFWQHGPFRWRFDDQPYQSVGGNVALLDDAPIRQFVVANWIGAGAVTLSPGKHTLRIELTENKGAAAFDAFLLTRGLFSPRGKLRPGEKYNRAMPGWFAWEPDPDPFSRASPIDLRALNEKSAGENGFIQAKGEDFVHGKTGKPVRFWAVNTGGETMNLPRASVDGMARSLAKQGVNLIRIHGGVWQPDNLRQVDREHLDRMHYFIAAMKRQGIYTSLSIYFPLWLQLKDSDGFAGYDSAKTRNPFALLYFNPEFQAIYRNWWKTVLTRPNPYASGSVPLARDPAVAFAEMVNEDSYFFWTFTPYENIPGPQMAILEKQFGDWAAKKYGSLEKTRAAWGTGTGGALGNGGAVRGDDAGAGRLGFRPLYELFNNKDQRSRDTVAFLTQSQQAFYADTYAYLKKSLNFGGSVYGSNWITADARVLGPLDKYTNAVTADLMDRHGYFGGPHEGPRASYSLSVGDKYDDRSALLFSPNKPGEQPDFSLPIWDLRYNNKPSIITEINWTTPNRYRADLPLLAAAYGALQGTDALFFFATGSPSWEQTLAKFSIRTPVISGQFPAAALIYRKGLVRPAAPVVDINLSTTDLLALEGSPVTAPANLDEFRAKDIPAGKTVPVDNLAALDPLAFAVGKVNMNIAPAPSRSRVADLSKFIDRSAKTVRSQTGELAWNWGAGRAVVNAPAAQGVTGFLSQAGPIRLRNATITAEGMDYGTIVLVALDDKPLATSGRMLLQVMSEDTNYGWEASDKDASGLREIKNLGSAPLVVKNLGGTVALSRPDAARLKVTALDFNGYRSARVGNAKSITLGPRTVYYLIEK